MSSVDGSGLSSASCSGKTRLESDVVMPPQSPPRKPWRRGRIYTKSSIRVSAWCSVANLRPRARELQARGRHRGRTDLKDLEPCRVAAKYDGFLVRRLNIVQVCTGFAAVPRNVCTSYNSSKPRRWPITYKHHGRSILGVLRRRPASDQEHRNAHTYRCVHTHRDVPCICKPLGWIIEVVSFVPADLCRIGRLSKLLLFLSKLFETGSLQLHPAKRK